jgi:hypothetical protein
MKLTLELDDGFKHSVITEGPEYTLEQLQMACVLLDEWHKEWTKNA